MSNHQDLTQPRDTDGQYGTKARAEAAVTLDAPALVLGRQVEVDNEDEDDFDRTWTAPGKGNASFDIAVRALLGVSDQRRKVIATMNHTDGGTEYTPESWEDITVSCAGREKMFQTLPELMRALELAQATPPTLELLGVMLGQNVLVHCPGGQVWPARVENVNQRIVYFSSDLRPEHFGGWDLRRDAPTGRWQLRTEPARFLSVEVPAPFTAEEWARNDYDRTREPAPSGSSAFDSLPEAERERLAANYAKHVARLAGVLART